MKKIFIIFFIFISFFSSYVYANNTEENIKKAVLVENYITNQKEKIEEYIIKYSIYNKTINYNISELDNLIKILKSIQNKNIEKDKAEKMLIKILKKIKSVNNELKILLKKEKDLYNKEFIKKLNLYSELGKKISDKIDNINYKIAESVLKNKTILSMKESNIKKHLIKLNNENKKLKNFSKNKYNSENKMKNSFVEILKNIKNELFLIKKSLK